MGKFYTFFLVTLVLLTLLSRSFGPSSFVFAEPIMVYDSTVQGEVHSVEKKHIRLRNKTINLCKRFEVHNANGNLIDKENLKLALKIKAYIKKGCASRIDILKFSE